MKFELYYPVKPFIVTQKFGETAFLEYYKANGVIFDGHNGIDLATPYSAEVYAAHDGVVEVQVDVNQGHGVVLTSSSLYEYKGENVYFKTIYWHLIDNIPVKTGQRVKAGDLIGYADSTGLSTGNHLHFGLKPMKKGKSGFYNVEQTNGTHGAIDPAPYLNGKFAIDLSRHIFNTDMELGQKSDEIRRLQEKLQALGYFPREQGITGYYGEVTRKAVFDFQKMFIVLSWWARYVHKGRYCSTQTREALNSLT